MNFYKAQDDARKQTLWLLALFTIAVVLLVLLTNLCVAFFVLYSNPEYALDGVNPIADAGGNIFQWCENLITALGWKKFTWTTLLVVGVLAMAMLFKWLSLRDGGRVVAEALGGRPVLTNSSQAQEKRLLNVVEEIALAAGIPVPQVYLLEKEPGINAFAAGLSVEDAVIGVTQGCLDTFNRDQLQGVIAHEFSHVLNGDMRLNMKLLVVLHGILMISESGHMVMRMTSQRGRRYRSYGHGRNNGGVVAGLFAFGLCLWLLGSIGQLFGMIIKSAVSRQREFLADASAVQFTRNPNGIGEALSLIGGATAQSQVVHHGAHEVSHLFFSRIGSPRRYFTQFFATHPPLEERIRRVMPRWSGRFMKPSSLEREASVLSGSGETVSSFAGSEQVVEPTIGEQKAESAKPVEHKPIEFEPAFSQDGVFKSAYDLLVGKAHEPSEAPALMCAVLLDEQEAVVKKQLKIVSSSQKGSPQKIGGDLADSVADMIKPLAELNSEQRLEIVELSIPALKLMSLVQYRHYRSLFLELIHADGKIDVFEWLIFQLLKQHCDRYFGLSRPEKPKYKDIKKIASLYQVVLSRIVYYGLEREQATYQQAFKEGCEAASVAGITLLPISDCQSARFTRAVHDLG
ncbi:hypothetical protein A3743_25835, partial [Oleiphilus sp. HI0072]